MDKSINQNIENNKLILEKVFENFLFKKENIIKSNVAEGIKAVYNPIIPSRNIANYISDLFDLSNPRGPIYNEDREVLISFSLLHPNPFYVEQILRFFSNKEANLSIEETVTRFLKKRGEVEDKIVSISTIDLYSNNSLDLIKLIIDNNILDSVAFFPENFFPGRPPFVLLNLSKTKIDNDVNVLDLTEFSNNDPYVNVLPIKVLDEDFTNTHLSYVTTTKKLISNDYFIHKKEYSYYYILGKEIFQFAKSDINPIVFDSNYNVNYISLVLETASEIFKKEVGSILKDSSNYSIYKTYLLNYPIKKLSLNEQCDIISSKYYEVLKVNEYLKSENKEQKSVKEDLKFLVGTFDHTIKRPLGGLVSNSDRLKEIIEDNPEIKDLKKKNKWATLGLYTVSNRISEDVETLVDDIKESVNNIENIENHIKEKLNLSEFVEKYKKLDTKFDYDFEKKFIEKSEFFTMVNKKNLQEIIENLIFNAFEHAFSAGSKNLLKMSLIEYSGSYVLSISNSGKKFEMSLEEFFTYGTSTKEGDSGKGGALIKRHITKNDINLKLVHLNDKYTTRFDLYLNKMTK